SMQDVYDISVVVYCFGCGIQKIDDAVGAVENLFFRFTAIARNPDIIKTFESLSYHGLQQLSTMYVAVWRTIFCTQSWSNE
ncbi:hypothetical protein MP228_005844, partial [Amoeboaphelidium protococcarum]